MRELESGDFLGFRNNRQRRGGASRSNPPWRRRLRRAADYFAAASLMLLVAVGAAWFARLGEQEVRGAFKVLDGDSLELGDQRYRLKGIDAPEYSQICRRNGENWPCGREAARRLRLLVSQGGGRGGIACSGGEIDKYGRLLVICKAGGTDINRQMVLEGWAVSFGDYEGAERDAARNGNGIWAGEFERPRDWRQLHGAADEDSAAGNFAASLANRGRLWLRSVTNWFGE